MIFMTAIGHTLCRCMLLFSFTLYLLTPHAATALAELVWRVEAAPAADIAVTETRTVSAEDLLLGELLLVNEEHPLPHPLPESLLVNINPTFENADTPPAIAVQLMPAAHKALLKMQTAANEAGMKHYCIREGYRTLEQQTEIFQATLDRLSDDAGLSDPVAEAKKKVNSPGTSEYQTGLAFRMGLYAPGQRFDLFSETAQGEWWLEHCWEYGFVLRFPTDEHSSLWGDKTSATQKTPVIDLYRYVGVAHGAAMASLKLCLEEYVAYLQANPHVRIYEGDTLRYEILRIKADEGATTYSLPLIADSSDFTASFDNAGGIVIVYEMSTKS